MRVIIAIINIRTEQVLTPSHIVNVNLMGRRPYQIYPINLLLPFIYCFIHINILNIYLLMHIMQFVEHFQFIIVYGMENNGTITGLCNINVRMSGRLAARYTL